VERVQARMFGVLMGVGVPIPGTFHVERGSAELKPTLSIRGWCAPPRSRNRTPPVGTYDARLSCDWQSAGIPRKTPLALCPQKLLQTPLLFWESPSSAFLDRPQNRMSH
jgi:hypothetical protein